MGQDLSRDLPVTAYALLGLLSFGDSLTGYELKQRADRTLRFYWVSPAMSQVYSELDRLHEHGLVRAHGRRADDVVLADPEGHGRRSPAGCGTPPSASRCSSTRWRSGCSSARWSTPRP